MVDVEINGKEIRWVIDQNLGHWLFETINNSSRVRFVGGIAILVKLIQFGEDTNLVRMTGEDVDEPDDWGVPFSLMDPEMRLGSSFKFKLKTENPKEVRMAVYSRTNNGANFVHEFYQEKNKDARAIIRVPVPGSLREEALAIADKYENCEMTREQAGAFQERFNITDEPAPTSYWEPHIECKAITSKKQIKDIFTDVLDIVERGVRASG